MLSPPPRAITTIDIISLAAFTISLVILSCLYHRRRHRSLPIPVPQIDTKPPASQPSVLEPQKKRTPSSDPESGDELQIDIDGLTPPRRREYDFDCVRLLSGSCSRRKVLFRSSGAKYQGIVGVMADAETGNFGSMQVKGIRDVVQGDGEWDDEGK